MKASHKIALLSLGVALSLVSSAYAYKTLPGAWYLDGNLGSARMSGQNFGAGTSNTNNGLGFGINLGYKFTPYFAAEVGYTGYPDIKIKNNADGNQFAKDTHQSYDIAAVGIFPVADTGVEVYGKLGATRMYSHVIVSNATEAALVPPSPSFNPGTKFSTGFYYGAGASYAFLPYLLGELQWARAKGSASVGTGDLYSVGVKYLIS